MSSRKNLFRLMPLLLLFFAGSCSAPAGKDGNTGMPELRFNENRLFRIAQFTDIHWKNNNPDECAKTIQMIRNVLDSENPDLVVLTGDIVNDPAEQGWKTLMAVFTEAGVPFAVTLGNHDDEAEWSREDIFTYLETLPGFMGSKGPPEITGTGNYILPIARAAGDSIAALLWFFDSNAYCDNKNISDYDWIKFDQIVWYREQSSRYTTSNHGNPYPALAFFHIPLPEYAEVTGSPTTMGIIEEDVYAPKINSGLFASFVEMKDVMGTFVGHDHNNNYIGIHKEIALAYGQSSGYSGYGTVAKGSRIIELREGEFSFNTWVVTSQGKSGQYNYPFGYSAEAEPDSILPAIQADLPLRGIRYKYFEGMYKKLSDVPWGNPVKEGIVENITLDVADAVDFYALEFSGLLKVPVSGYYRFYTFSDDGSQLFIGNRLVVDNDGSHSPRRAEGIIALEEGYHNFRLLYFEDHQGQKLEAGYSSVSMREKVMPDSVLFHME
jgi:hypothetical protein